jgi:CRP-like cAMP-binding protein
MLFPGSRIWYEGAAADLIALTDEIKSSGFTGHVVLEFQDSIDVVICVGGEFLKVIEKIGRRLLSTKKYREIWGKCQIKAGRMTIFELPPPLARRLRGLQGRRLLCSGTAATGCDPARVLADLRGAEFSGVVDCVTPEGKLLLDLERGAVVGCYYSAYAGLSLRDMEAFRAWHRGFVRSTHPCAFHATVVGAVPDGQYWDEILMESADQVPLPLAGSVERVSLALGRDAAPGDLLFEAGTRPGRAWYLFSGEVELRTAGGGAAGTLQPGSLIGVDWLCGAGTARVSGRALVASRYLAVDASRLATVFENSPALAVRFVRGAAGALAAQRARLAAYREEPRLYDVDAAVSQALGQLPPGESAGVPAAALFRELTQRLPLSLQEIDALFRRLAALGGVSQAGGRVTLSAREI